MCDCEWGRVENGKSMRYGKKLKIHSKNLNLRRNRSGVTRNYSPRAWGQVFQWLGELNDVRAWESPVVMIVVKSVGSVVSSVHSLQSC